MSAQYYTNLSWDSYQESLKKGFSDLQQREEFVDMTLSAEGYLIKVHKNVVALVSPYLREMINSTPCQHPVIFLSNIAHEVLVHIVEYIYTGESQVPSNILPSFFKAASELHLCGLGETSILQSATTALNEHNYGIHSEPATQSVVASDSNEPDTVVSELLGNSNACQERLTLGILDENNRNANAISVAVPIENDINVNTNVINEGISSVNNDIFNVTANISIGKDYKPQQYSVSSRGSWQLIFNRFIYYLHHQSGRGLKRRWRCFDYRKNHCKAYIDTVGEKIVERRNEHNHTFHDDKILKKVRQNKIYGSVSCIEVQEASEINLIKK